MTKSVKRSQESTCDKGRYATLPEAAKALGIPVSTLRRAVNAGSFPVYQPFAARRRVILSEVEAAIVAHKTGGQQNG